jgi:hypothetical protein
MGEHRFTVRVTAPARGVARVHARKHSLEAGAPVSFDAEHPRLTALELLAGALGAEIAGGLRQFGAKRRLEIDDVEVVTHVELADPMVWLRAVDHRGDPRLGAVEVKAYIGSLEDERAVKALWDEVLERSPIVSTLRGAVPMTIAYQQVL